MDLFAVHSLFSLTHQMLAMTGTHKTHRRSHAARQQEEDEEDEEEEGECLPSGTSIK